jgi:hypothetical protein
MNGKTERSAPDNLIRLTVAYVAGLIAVVARAVTWPLSTPVICLLFAWLVPFFLLDLVANILAITLLAGTVYRGMRTVSRKKLPRHSPGGVWDRALDD